MANSRLSPSRSNQSPACAINVGETERKLSTIAGGIVLLYGLSRLSVSAIFAVAAGGALLYRGLTGRCPGYQALDMSTARGLGNDEPVAQHGRHPSPEGTDASLAATGESPRISAG